MLVLLSLFLAPPFLCNVQLKNIILQLCKALSSLRRYGEALEIINLTLRLAHTSLSAEKKEELRSLGARKS